MRKIALLVMCLMIIVCIQQCIGNQDSISVKPPVWKKGDSWRVKCPVYVNFHGDMKLYDYYTLLVEVMSDENVRGQECYVLKISSQPDYIKAGDVNSSYKSFVYYTKTDLAVRCIKTDLWRNGKLTSIAEYSERGDTVFGLDVSYPTMPILIPRFPIKMNNLVERYYKEFKQKHRVSTESQSASEENKVKSIKITEVSVSDDSSEIAPGATSSQSAREAVVVKFMQTDAYSKTSDRESRLLTEKWVPGQKWWISARRGDRKQIDAGSYILDDSYVAPK